MSAALLVFVLFLGAAVAVAVFAAGMKLPDVLLQRRLEARLRDVQRPAGEEPGELTLVKTRAEGPLPLLDRLVERSAKAMTLARLIEQAGLKVSVSAVLLAAAGAALAGGLLLSMLVRSPFSWPVGAAGGFAAPFLVLRHLRTRRFRKFEEQFPEALDLVARALKAGHGFASGLKMVAEELDEPVGPEFRKTFDEQNFGLPLKDALQNLTDRIPLLDVKFFATAVLIQRDTGGNLAEILENLAHVVRERFKILRQVRVYTAHGRLTGYVLLALPAALAVALMFINPDHMNLLFRERIGQTLLVIAIVLQTVGYFWIRRIVKIEV
ncbi:MAG TPA: type II secretion system F family protein [Vicinamibacterales bacterium]|nr:type II secretion system F family protein [Vicinamibacterales bacterium]